MSITEIVIILLKVVQKSALNGLNHEDLAVRLWKNILSAFPIKCFKCSYSKNNTLLNFI